MTNRKPLVIFIACFIIPVVAAIAVLKSGWLPASTSNNGTLMSKQVELEQWGQYPVSPWTIALVNQADCGPCQAQWQDMQSLYVALGKNQSKVRMAVLGERPRSAGVPEVLYVDSVPSALKAGHLYLIDRHGLVVLEYDYAEQEQQNRLIHKGLLKDIKKLLNYSRSS